jgi:hypothetical protein
MLSSIQVLRGIAAVMVVLFHVCGFQIGAAGVDIFFVISGFIMFHTNRNVFGLTGAAILFLKRRILRIAPLYWLCSAFAFWPGVELKSLVASVLFVPVRSEDGSIHTVLAPGWSLNFEMFFYIVFGGFDASTKIWLACDCRDIERPDIARSGNQANASSLYLLDQSAHFGVCLWIGDSLRLRERKNAVFQDGNGHVRPRRAHTSHILSFAFSHTKQSLRRLFGPWLGTTCCPNCSRGRPFRSRRTCNRPMAHPSTSGGCIILDLFDSLIRARRCC